MQPTPQDNQLMSKHRVLSFKPQLRLEWRGQDGQNETEQPDHSASLGDSITSSTRIRFSVHTGQNKRPQRGAEAEVTGRKRFVNPPIPSFSFKLYEWPNLESGVAYFGQYRPGRICHAALLGRTVSGSDRGWNSRKNHRHLRESEDNVEILSACQLALIIASRGACRPATRTA